MHLLALWLDDPHGGAKKITRCGFYIRELISNFEYYGKHVGRFIMSHVLRLGLLPFSVPHTHTNDLRFYTPGACPVSGVNRQLPASHRPVIAPCMLHGSAPPPPPPLLKKKFPPVFVPNPTHP